MPAERDTLVAFFELFSVTASYNHLKNVYSSIKFLHKALNYSFIEDEFQVDTILQSLKRKIARVPFQVLPITPKIFMDMYNFIDISKPCDIALWSSFLVCFYCLFRKANVAPKNFDSFNSHKELSRRKFCFLEAEEMVLVYSNFSKTNQFMNRDSVIPLLKHDVRALDPIFHLKLLFLVDMSEDFPAFSYFENGRVQCITYTVFTKRLKTLLELSGYSPKLYSGHSMRRGGATLLFQLNCDPLIIQAIGDWSSDHYLKYLGLSLDQRFAAQQLMVSVTT